MKRRYKLIIVLIISSLLTGCWDYKDINRRSITLSVGVDKIDDEFQFSGEIAKFSPSGNEKMGGPKNKEVYSYISTGRNFEEARKNYDIKLPLEDFSGAMRAVIFGKDYAESGIESYINRINHLTELRKSLLIVVSRETPKELFQRKIVNDIAIGYAVEDTIRHLSENGKSIYKTAQEIQKDIQNKDIGYIIPYIGIENETIDFLGFAVMGNSEMIGIINKNECSGFLYLLLNKATNRRAVYNISNKGTIYSVATTLQRRKINTNYLDKKVNIDIELKLILQLQYQYYTELLNDSLMKEIENEVAKEIKKEVVYAINRSQKELKVDLFEFAKYFKAQNPKTYKEINWREEYPNANINVNVETKIKDINLINPNNKK